MYILTALSLVSGFIFSSQINPKANETDSLSLNTKIEQVIDHQLGESRSNWLQQLEPNRYDSLLTRYSEENAYLAFERYFDEFINIDSAQYLTSAVPDSVYEARLKMILSPIQMPFNDVVKRHIIAYTTNRKSTVEYVLGRAQYYFPMIEQELDRAGLPLELKMLPVIESALSPVAVSRVGATGMWQFMYGTAKTYGLEISSFIDQRRDPVLATKAACGFLRDLYEMYGDWTLALAAYNCGPGGVNKAIKRAGGKADSFWDIYPYLPKETRGYVPSFIAISYAYAFHKNHNIEPRAHEMPLSTDSIMINRLLHFQQISSTIDTPMEIIRTLNPQYKLDIIPAIGKSYSLRLPTADISRFIENESQILAKDTTYLSQYLKPSNLDKKKMEFSIDSFTYRVKSGDTLSGIAAKNNVTVSQIMKWNNMKNAHKLKIGQKLEIYR